MGLTENQEKYPSVRVSDLSKGDAPGSRDYVAPVLVKYN